MSKPLITQISTKKFGNTKQDNRVTEEVTHDRHLAPGAGKWSQYKIKPSRLKPVTTAFGRVTNPWKAFTLPWDDGRRLCAPARYPMLKPLIDEAIENAMKVVKAEIQDPWHEIIEEARIAQNGDFRPELYPSQADIASHFQIEFEIFPFPESSHFDGKLAELFGEQLESLTAARLAEAEQEAWDRMIEPLAKMAKKLADPEAIFRDTLVTNIQDMCDLIPEMNYTNNPSLSVAIESLTDFAKINPEDLRSLPAVRKDTAIKAAAIAAKFSESKRVIKLKK